MPVSEDVDLRLVSEKDLEKLNKEADKLSKMADKAEKDAEKIKRAARMKGGGPPQDIPKRSVPISGGPSGGEFFIGESSGGPEFTKDRESYKRMRFGGAPQDIRSQAGANGPIFGGQTGRMKGGGAPQDISKENISTNRLKEDEKKILTLEEKIAKTQNFLQSGFSFLRNPGGFLQGGAFSLLGRLGLAGAVAQFGIGFIQDIFEEIKGQFGPGGLFDTRKLVLNEVKTVTSLDTLINISNGNLFFTDDAGLTLRQSAPEYSNTRDLRNGHLRYIQQYRGT